MELGLDMSSAMWDKMDELIELMVAKLREWSVPCALLSPQK
jgi:hypothetical protein